MHFLCPSPGREFIEAEELLYSGRHVTYWDSFEAAIQCFLLAIRVRAPPCLTTSVAVGRLGHHEDNVKSIQADTSSGTETELTLMIF